MEKQLIEGNIDMLYREAQYMQLFAHRCIPHLFGVKVDEKPLALIMEFLGKDNKSLTIHKLLYSPFSKGLKSELCVKDWLSISFDITDALSYIHSKGYLHCDIKTDNTLVFKTKGYLIDFGKVKPMACPSAKKYEKHYNHIAPEVLKGNPASSASDVYSLGRIILAIGQATGTKLLNDLGTKSISCDPKQRPCLSIILGALTPI